MPTKKTAARRPGDDAVAEETKQAELRRVEAALQRLDSPETDEDGLEFTQAPGGVTIPMTTVSESVDGTKVSFDQAMAEAWSANVKAMFEQHIRDVERERGQQNSLDSFSLRVAEQQNALAVLIQSAAATLINRTAQNAATVDHLANMAGLAQLSEYRGIGAQVAEQAAEAATGAINSALAQGAQSNPVAQGTTGLAQGAIQAGVAGVNVALLTDLAEAMKANNTVQLAILEALAGVNKAIGVILVKVVGDTVVTEPVPTA